MHSDHSSLTVDPQPCRRPLVIQKFGGTSVGSVARIHNVAALAMAEQRAGKDVVVVVSAMSGETNRLLGLATEVSDLGTARERDAIAACGEQAAAGLTAIAIEAAGGRSRSFLGHQIRILTDSHFGDARIVGVEASALRAALDRGEIPVVAGFQGIDADGNITTLGRGGSDTTAVAVAHALGAATCDIYTDVDGVYTADPNIVPSARKLARVPYEHMLTFASLGAKVLHDRSVELARLHNVIVHVRTSFGDTPGTMISVATEQESGTSVGGLALDRKLIRAFLSPGQDPSQLSKMLSASGLVIVDSFPDAVMMRSTDLPALRSFLRGKGYPMVCIEDIARVSIVGSALDERVRAKAKHLVEGLGIKLHAEVLAERHCSLYVSPECADEVMRIVHDGMGIGVGAEHGAQSAPSPGRRR